MIENNASLVYTFETPLTMKGRSLQNKIFQCLFFFHCVHICITLHPIEAIYRALGKIVTQNLGEFL